MAGVNETELMFECGLSLPAGGVVALEPCSLSTCGRYAYRGRVRIRNRNQNSDVTYRLKLNRHDATAGASLLLLKSYPVDFVMRDNIMIQVLLAYIHIGQCALTIRLFAQTASVEWRRSRSW